MRSLPVPEWTWCDWRAVAVFHWYSWYRAAQRSSSESDKTTKLLHELKSVLTNSSSRQIVVAWQSRQWVYLENFKSCNVENANEWSTFTLCSVKWLVDSWNNPFEHSLIKRLWDSFNGKLSLWNEGSSDQTELKHTEAHKLITKYSPIQMYQHPAVCFTLGFIKISLFP